MIRGACTWLLVVLAASPFTAPFSTCDLSALLGRLPSTVVVAPVAVDADITACSEIGDAGNISPLVVRVVLTRDSILGLSDGPVPSAPDTPLRAVPGQCRALPDVPLQPLVLRL